MDSNIIINIESPFQEEIEQFIRELNEVLLRATPIEHCFHMTAAQLADSSCVLLVARNTEGVAMGMGALKKHGVQPISPGRSKTIRMGEVKRMYTAPAFLRIGVAKSILAAIERVAREEEIELLVLDTGAGNDLYKAAWGLYERMGFKQRDRFLDCPDDGFRLFYEKEL